MEKTIEKLLTVRKELGKLEEQNRIMQSFLDLADEMMIPESLYARLVKIIQD